MSICPAQTVRLSSNFREKEREREREERHLSRPDTLLAIVKTLFIDTRVKDRSRVARILAK